MTGGHRAPGRGFDLRPARRRAERGAWRRAAGGPQAAAGPQSGSRRV